MAFRKLLKIFKFLILNGKNKVYFTWYELILNEICSIFNKKRLIITLKLTLDLRIWIKVLKSITELNR